MATTKAEKAVEQTAKEVQKTVDQVEERGYFGESPDPRPNSDYSLESGPDSPSAVQHDRARAAQPPLEV